MVGVAEHEPPSGDDADDGAVRWLRRPMTVRVATVRLAAAPGVGPFRRRASASAHPTRGPRAGDAPERPGGRPRSRSRTKRARIGAFAHPLAAGPRLRGHRLLHHLRGGLTDWLVRFLEPAPLSVATTALALYWAGMAVGRLGSARVADRFDHLQFATTAAVAMSVALAGAILMPPVEVSVGLFALAGLAVGPVAPMIMVVGGDRYPDRAAAVGGYLTTAAVVGTIGFPPLMGFLAVTVGLKAAMLGTVALAPASAGSLLLAGRARGGLPVVVGG